MAAPADDDEEEYEICNDDGFVYKRRRGLYPEVAPTSVPAAGPDPEALRRRRRRRVLRRLLEERRRELKSWEALDRKVQAQQNAPVPTPPQVPPASPGAAATDDQPASSASPGPAVTVDRPVSSLLHDVHAHLNVREEIVKNLAGLCNEFEELHGAYIAGWPVWGNPKELGSLQSPDSPGSSSDGLTNELSFERDYLSERNEACRIRVESASDANEQGQTMTGLGNARTHVRTGKFHSSGVHQLVHNIEVHEQDKLMQQVDLSNDPSTLSENRKKKRVASPHGSRSVKKPKRTRQSPSPNLALSRLRHRAGVDTAENA